MGLLMPLGRIGFGGGFDFLDVIVIVASQLDTKARWFAVHDRSRYGKNRPYSGPGLTRKPLIRDL